MRYDTAYPSDEAQLRDVLAATPMDGHVRVSFRRDPDFFGAGVVEGPFRQTLVARDGERIAGLGCRSIRSRYVNGQCMPIGYLSGLRLRPQYRGSGLLARGYRYLRTLHQDGRTRLYLTTITEGNDVARRVLTSARTWLPHYHPAGKYCTFVVPIRGRRISRVSTPVQLDIRRAHETDLPAILDFLVATGPRHQFFPNYKAHDFFHHQGTFRDLRASDILLAYQQQRLVGLLGAWDQRQYRQTVVEGYSGLLNRLRGVYNFWARLRHSPQLPAPHQVFPFITAALPIVTDHNSAVFRALVSRLIRNRDTRATGSDRDYLLLGLHEDDPLAATARTFATHVYVTHLFYVCWEDGEPLRQNIDQRLPPYLELGCL